MPYFDPKSHAISYKWINFAFWTWFWSQCSFANSGYLKRVILAWKSYQSPETRFLPKMSGDALMNLSSLTELFHWIWLHLYRYWKLVSFTLILILEILLSMWMNQSSTMILVWWGRLSHLHGRDCSTSSTQFMKRMQKRLVSITLLYCYFWVYWIVSRLKEWESCNDPSVVGRLLCVLFVAEQILAGYNLGAHLGWGELCYTCTVAKLS